MDQIKHVIIIIIIIRIIIIDSQPNRIESFEITDHALFCSFFNTSSRHLGWVISKTARKSFKLKRVKNTIFLT